MSNFLSLHFLAKILSHFNRLTFVEYRDSLFWLIFLWRRSMSAILRKKTRVGFFLHLNRKEQRVVEERERWSKADANIFRSFSRCQSVMTLDICQCVFITQNFVKEKYFAKKSCQFYLTNFLEKLVKFCTTSHTKYLPTDFRNV